MDAPVVANFAYSHKAKMESFDEQRAITLTAHGMTWIIFELEQDILVLSIVSKLHKVPFEITELETLHRKQWQNFKNKGQSLQKEYCDIGSKKSGKTFWFFNIMNKFDSSD